MLARLTPATRTLVVLCLAAWFWSFSFGLGAPLASVWLKDAGYSETIVGLNTGIYYLGIALAAIGVPWLMRRWLRGTLIVGMTAGDIPVTTGNPDQGFEGYRFVGYNLYDSLLLWDLPLSRRRFSTRNSNRTRSPEDPRWSRPVAAGKVDRADSAAADYRLGTAPMRFTSTH